MTRGYLEEIEAQLVERVERGEAGAGVPERGMAPRRGPLRPRREWLGLVPALAAGAAIIAIVVLTGVLASPSRPAAAGSHGATPPRTATHRHSQSRPRAHARPHGSTRVHSGTRGTAVAAPAGPVPAGFGPVSFTALSDVQWWLLGSAPCSSPPCTSIVRTDNGGRSFVGIPAPRTTRVSELRFADPRNGYAFGPQLWVTHDAGASWRMLNLGGSVIALEAADGYVYAIVRSASGSGQLLRAPVGSDSWTVLSAAGNAFTGLWVYGPEVLLETSNSSASRQELAISQDQGASFTHHPAPPSVALGFEGIGPVVWAEGATGTMSGVWRSNDGGAHFAFVGGNGWPQTNGLPSQPNSAAFAASSPSSAVYGYRVLYRTADGGSSWHPVLGNPGITWWQYLGFTDATHGVAIGYTGSSPSPATERLYYTTDGGQSYHRVTIAAG